MDMTATLDAVVYWIGLALILATPLAHGLVRLADALAERAARTSDPADNRKAARFRSVVLKIVRVLDAVSDNIPTMRRGAGDRRQ